MFAANMLKISVWDIMFGFVICFYVCILLLVNCDDLLSVKFLFHDLLSAPIFQHIVWSVITAH